MPNKPPILLSNRHFSSLGGEIKIYLKMKMSYFPTKSLKQTYKLFSFEREKDASMMYWIEDYMTERLL